MNEKTKKEQIINSAFELFITEGYEVGINRIIEHAQISRGGLYHHFKNKKELFEVVIQRYFFDYFTDFSDIVSGEGDFRTKVEQIIELTLHPFHVIEKYASRTKNSGYITILSVIRNNTYLQQLQDDFDASWNQALQTVAEQGIKEGCLNDDTDIGGFINSLRLLVDGTLISAYYNSLEDAREKLHRSLSFMLYGKRNECA